MISLFPINMITDRPRGRDDLRTQRESDGENEGWVSSREKNHHKRLPVREMSSLLVKMLLSRLLLWLEVQELFSVRKAFLFVIKDWKWKHFRAEKNTNRHNNVMQFFFSTPTLSKHSNPSSTGMSRGLVKNVEQCDVLQFALEDLILTYIVNC